jgi:hypothetical protein
LRNALTRHSAYNCFLHPRLQKGIVTFLRHVARFKRSCESLSKNG